MTEETRSENEIIAIKSVINLQRQAASGLAVFFIDMRHHALMGNFTLLIKGQEFLRISKDAPNREIIKNIQKGSADHEVSALDSRLKGALEKGIPRDYIHTIMECIERRDLGAAESILKRVFENMLAVDMIDVVLGFEFLSIGDFAEIRVEVEVEKLTLSQKIKMIMFYAQNKVEVAEKIVRENLKDIGIIKTTFHKDNRYYGYGLITVSLLNKKLISVILSLGPDKSWFTADVNMPLLDFYKELMDTMEKAAQDSGMISQIDRKIRELSINQLCDAITSESPDAVKDLITKSVAGTLHDDTVVKCTSLLINSLRMELLLNPDKKSLRTENDDSVLGADAAGLKVIRVDLILSPTRGKNISSLKPGNKIQVLLDASNPLGMNLLRRLDLVAGDKIKPMGAVLHSIKYDPQNGYTIYFKIAEGIIGKAVEEHDIKIKTVDPVVEPEINEGRGSLIVGILAGILVLIIIGILVWFF